MTDGAKQLLEKQKRELGFRVLHYAEEIVLAGHRSEITESDVESAGRLSKESVNQQPSKKELVLPALLGTLSASQLVIVATVQQYLPAWVYSFLLVTLPLATIISIVVQFSSHEKKA
jgi:hypothetical protein